MLRVARSVVLLVLLVMAGMIGLVGCSSEYEARFQIRMSVTNTSSDDDLYYVLDRGEVRAESVVLDEAGFGRVLPGETVEIGLGPQYTGDDSGGCLADHEQLWLIHGPPGHRVPIQDNDGRPVTMALRSWVPDVEVWQVVEAGSCFDGRDHSITWPG